MSRYDPETPRRELAACLLFGFGLGALVLALVRLLTRIPT